MVRDRRPITLWLDLNSLEVSIAPKEQARQRRGEMVRRKLDFDPTDLRRVETIANSD